MTQYRPAMDNLLTTVRQFLDDLGPQLEGETKYKAQVCAFLLAVCSRELAAGNAPDAADHAAWSFLLDGAQGSADDLSRALCAKIRTGDFDAEFDQVLDVVLARTTAAAHLVRPDQIPAPDV